jgi:hypothetical protein
VADQFGSQVFPDHDIVNRYAQAGSGILCKGPRKCGLRRNILQTDWP